MIPSHLGAVMKHETGLSRNESAEQLVVAREISISPYPTRLQPAVRTFIRPGAAHLEGSDPT
jgi:hypothetical protein